VAVLEGKVALVTGGSRCVGAAIAKSLAQEGAAVIVNYLKSADKAEEVARAIRNGGGKALPHGADITDEEAVRGMVRAMAETFGPVAVLVNNALPDYRFDPTTRKDLASVRWEDYLQQLGALRGALYCSQTVVPGMVEKGGKIIDDTDASAATTGEVRQLVAGSTPLRRLGTPEDLGRAVLMFASPWSEFVTGQYITCDGGLIMP
jgi:3-oxoacyl-[acyl-carrier protein] reductase